MPARSHVMLEGLIAGVIGYAAVAVCIAILDLIGGRALFETPSLLGQILIGGFGEPTPGEVAAAPVFAFNGLHLLVFLAIGIAAAWLVHEMELHPVIWYGVFFAVLSAVLVSFIVLSFVSEAHQGLLSQGALHGANAVAAVAIGWYLHRSHPRLGEKIRTFDQPE